MKEVVKPARMEVEEWGSQGHRIAVSRVHHPLRKLPAFDASGNIGIGGVHAKRVGGGEAVAGEEEAVGVVRGLDKDPLA